MPLFSKISRGIWPFDGAAEDPGVSATVGDRAARSSGTGLDNQQLESGNVRAGDFTGIEGMDNDVGGNGEGQEFGMVDQRGEARGKSVFFEAGGPGRGVDVQVDGDAGDDRVIDAHERVVTAKGVKKEPGMANQDYVPDAGNISEEQMERERQGQERPYIKSEPEDEEGHGVSEHEEERGEHAHEEDQGVDQLYDETNEFLQRVAEDEQSQHRSWTGSSHQRGRRHSGYGQNPDEYFNQMTSPEQQVPYQHPNMAMYRQRRMPPDPYQEPPAGYEQDAGFDPRGMFGHGLGNFQGQFYGMGSHHPQGLFPPHQYAHEMREQPRQFRHQYPQDYPPQYHQAPSKRKAADELMEDSDSDEQNYNDSQSSDDDEPLKTRTQRHHHEDPLNEQESPRLLSKTAPRGLRKSVDPNTEYMGTFTRPKKPAPLPPALPRLIPQAAHSPGPSSDNGATPNINWKLPTYEIRPSTPLPNTIPSLKISLPGQVREELLLSPDHSAQETLLLTHLFLPAQQSLRIPDPEPALATLNFHTIAVMVLDAFAAFEMGDEISGRGLQSVAQAEGRSAREADVDEIFFQVIDRWRVGMARGERESYALIRGVQEFCDVALDIIFWVKENGLVGNGEGKARKERSDKGVKRGKKKGDVLGETTVEKGTSGHKTAEMGGRRTEGGRAGATATTKKGVAVKKTGTAARPNELQARKKVKTEPVAKPKPNEVKSRKKQKTETTSKPKPKARGRPKAPALVVIQAQGKRK